MAILDLTFSIGLVVMAVVAYRERRHPLSISLGYLYLYAVALFCVLALLLNIGGVIWTGTSLALRAFAEEEIPETEGTQALLVSLPVVGHRTPIQREIGSLTRSEILERLARGIAAAAGMAGLWLLHLTWEKRMVRRVGGSPIAWGYRYALVLAGLLLFLSYAQDLVFTAAEAIQGSIDWTDELTVRFWARDLITYALDGGIMLVVWLLPWRKVWRTLTGVTVGEEAAPEAETASTERNRESAQ